MKSLHLLSFSTLTTALSIPFPLQQLLNGHGTTTPNNNPSITPTSHELNHIIDSSPLLSFHRDITKIESISGNEKNVGSFIIDFLSSHNFTVEKQLVEPQTTTTPERFNIYAYTNEDRHPDIILTSHIDTVPPFIPYSLHAPNTTTFAREDLLIAGRGSVDAKASVAAIIFAALETLSENPSTSLGLLLDVGEENSGVGMKTFSNSDLNPSPSTFHTIIFGEPTNLSLIAGHKGALGFRVVANGKAAHSGYPWLGKSAISAILPVLARLDALQTIPAEEGGLLRSDILGNSTLNIGTVRGGVAKNVVPAFAEADIAIRLAAGTPDETREIMRKAVDYVTGGDGSVYADFETYKGGFEPQHLDADVEGFEVITVNYGTDVPALEVHEREDGSRVKRYLYGPGSFYVPHSSHEAITVGEIEEAVRGYKRLIEVAVERHQNGLA
ncbi:putative acetylornithine deacetylase, partial [Aspergillus steynii IBT 23096]